MSSDLHCLPGSLDIGGIGSRNGTNLGSVYLRGDQAHRVKFSRGGDGKAAVERIEAHASEGLRNREFLFWEIVDARGLFAITQCCFIKFDDAWFCRHRQSLLLQCILYIAHVDTLIFIRTGVEGDRKLTAQGEALEEKYVHPHTKLPSETPLFRLSRIGNSFTRKIIRNFQREAQATRFDAGQEEAVSISQSTRLPRPFSL